MNAEGAKLKAIQGHTLDRFDINQLYEKITSVEHYVHHPLWRGEDAPDQLVFEINHENYLDNRKRMGTFSPSVNEVSYYEGSAGHCPARFWCIKCDHLRVH